MSDFAALPGAFHFKTVNTLYPVKNPFTKACFLSLNERLIELLTIERLFFKAFCSILSAFLFFSFKTRQTPEDVNPALQIFETSWINTRNNPCFRT